MTASFGCRGGGESRRHFRRQLSPPLKKPATAVIMNEVKNLS